MLRYDGPVQATSRVVLEDMKFRGKDMKAGQMVITFLGGANHDPAQFPEPEKFDLSRQDNRHLGFGQGIHYCVGAPLARVEAQTAVNALLQRYPHLEAGFERPDWGSSFILRGLRSLPLRSKVGATT
jgi:cytochrome P450